MLIPADHWHDVLIGSLVGMYKIANVTSPISNKNLILLALGLTFAFFAYRQYFPPLSDVKSHLPYRPRIDCDHIIDPILPVHNGGSGESTHGLHPVSPGGHYTDAQRLRDSSDSADGTDGPNRGSGHVDPPAKVHTLNHSIDGPQSQS